MDTQSPLIDPLNGTSVSSRVQQTVGQHLDENIKNPREQLEKACVLKARAEACQMLDYPQDFINQLFGW